MDVQELIDGCREAATTQDPVSGVVETLGAFLHQPHLDQHLGTADRSTYEALYRGATCSCCTEWCRRRPSPSIRTTIACGR